MSLRDAIRETEKGFWTGGADFYRDNVDEECLIAFAEIARVMTNAEVSATVSGGERWRDLEMAEKGFLQPSAETVLFTYEARAARPNGERYHALVSSLYRRRGGSWKLAFHQQTPLA